MNGTDFDNVLRMRETIANNPYLNEIISGGDYGVCLFGEVLGIHISDHLIKDGRVDIVAARPIARLGYSEYAVVDSKFSMRRPR